MFAGRSTRVQWQRNPDGQKRTVEEARDLAKKHGVHVHYEVDFFEDDEGELPPELMARGPRITKKAGGTVYWADLVNSGTGKVPYLVRPEVFQSDEAIVGVFGHLMYVLDALRPMINKGKTTIEDFITHIDPPQTGNLHQEAMKYAEELVEAMRNQETK